MSPTISNRLGTLAVLLTAAVLALALVLAAQAGARARGAACTHSAAGHPRHGAHPCAGSGSVSTGKSRGRGGRSHTHLKEVRHHTKHPAKPPGSAEAGEGAEEVGESGQTEAGGQESSPGPPEALCEDGSAPETEGGGVFTCEDGSQPQCTSGLKPVVSSNGSQLLCEAPSSGTRRD
jgi:hypothetical protein